MLKKYRIHIIITTLIMFLPMIFGAIIWNKLPDEIPIHWGINGEPDQFGTRAVAVFVVPLIPLVVHWICILATAFGRRAKDQNSKVIVLVLFICPLLSIVISSAMYLTVFGKSVDISLVILLFVGFIFALIGNYMPKCMQNKYIGIRVKWTLRDEDNWHATHRLASKLWLFGGIAIMGIAFLPDIIAFISTMCVLVLVTAVPIIYSYRFSKKKAESKSA